METQPSKTEYIIKNNSGELGRHNNKIVAFSSLESVQKFLTNSPEGWTVEKKEFILIEDIWDSNKDIEENIKTGKYNPSISRPKQPIKQQTLDILGQNQHPYISIDANKLDKYIEEKYKSDLEFYNQGVEAFNEEKQKCDLLFKNDLCAIFADGNENLGSLIYSMALDKSETRNKEDILESYIEIVNKFKEFKWLTDTTDDAPLKEATETSDIKS